MMQWGDTHLRLSHPQHNSHLCFPSPGKNGRTQIGGIGSSGFHKGSSMLDAPPEPSSGTRQLLQAAGRTSGEGPGPPLQVHQLG